MEGRRHAFEAGRRAGKREATGRTIAQMFCLLVGGGLVAAGILGFIFGGSDFNTGSNIQGEEFIGLEVNGWHNVVHIATGAFLLLMLPTARTAAMGALIFGLLYVGVAVWGFADGSDIGNVVAINNADNWLHVGLAAAGILAAVVGGGLAESAKRHRPDAATTTAEGRAAREGAVPVAPDTKTTRPEKTTRRR